MLKPNKKLLLSIFLFSFFLFFYWVKSVFAGCGIPSGVCSIKLVSPTNTCCTSGSCSSKCGTIGKWDYCYADSCCADLKRSFICSIGSGDPACYENIYWSYTYESCGATDSCLGGARLNAGLCTSSGCAKGGVYKVCCANGGGTCPHSCSGSNYSGTCGGGCYPV